MLPDREGGELLIVGDLHGHFDAQDIRFLDERRAELVVFVGDLGDEDPGLTERVCEVRAPKVVLLGNHDAWESFRHDAPSASLQQSLELLGDFHLAYRKIELPRLGVTLLGARPFSWGGPSLRSAP
ncbi:MAG: metallophosphoesterase, partial [Planctomycetota bacterium]